MMPLEGGNKSLVARPVPVAPAKPVEPKPVNDKKNLRRFPRLNAAKSNWFKPFTLSNVWREEGGPSRIGTMARLPRAQEPARVLPRLDGEWHKGEGIRFRVNYLNPVGFSRADEHGLLYNELGRFMQNPGEVLPRAYWGTYAIYRHGQTVDYEIEIENVGTKPIKNMDVLARQEVLSPLGGPGEALPGGVGRFQVPSLAPGQRVKLKNGFKVTSDWRFHGSFEQTHLRVTGAVQRGKPKLLAQAYQAGIIDPPPDD